MATEDPVEDVTGTSIISVSESRVRILKALRGNRQTVTELSRELELEKSTIHGYLKDLVEDGFVRRHDSEERLWVYYDLTPLGRRLVNRDRLRFAIDTSSIIALVSGAGLLAYRYLLPLGQQTPVGGGDPSPWGPPTAETGLPLLLVAAAVLVLLALLGWAARSYLRRRPLESPSLPDPR